MSTDALGSRQQVRPDAPVPEVATTLREQRIHRVLVVEDGKLCGIVSTFDLIRLLETDT